MTVKVRVVEKGVDKREVVPALMSYASYRIDCTLPRKLTEREWRNLPIVIIQVLYRLELRLPEEAKLSIQLNDV